MPDIERLQIESQVENLSKVVSWIDDFCAGHAPAAAFGHKLQITAEELIVNIVTHGYGESRKDGRIWLALHPQPEGVAMAIEDEAPPFDPLKDSPSPDTDADIEDRQIGGLGVMFVREMADRVAYSHAERNRIVLVFGPGPFPEPSDTGRDKGGPSGPGAAAQGGPDDKAPHDGPRWRPGKLTMQVLAVLLLLPMAGIAAAGALNFLKFERVLITTAAARYDPILHELVRAIGDSLGEGLTLASTRTTEQLIERSAAQFDGAFHLTVQDTDGAVLFTTWPDDENHGTVTPALPDLPALSPAETRHVFAQEDRFVTQMAIFQNDAPIGVLTLSHDATAVRSTLPGLARRITDAGVFSVIPALALLALLVLIVLGRIEGRFHNRRAAVEGVGNPDSPYPGSFDPLVRTVWRIGRVGEDTAAPAAAETGDRSA